MIFNSALFVFLLINKMPFIILTIYNTSMYFTGNYFSWQEVRDHQTFNSVNYSERCLLDDIAFNYLQTVFGPSFLEKIYHAKSLLIMLTFLKWFYTLKKYVLFPMLIHTRFLSVQFNKKASFFQRKFSFLYYKNFKYRFGHKRENPKILVWRKCFRGFICCKFIESIVANLPRTLLKTCSAIWEGKIPHKQGELPKHTQQADG